MLELARRLPDAQVTVIAPAAPGDARFDSTSGCRVRRVGSIRLGRFRSLVQLTLATMWACITDRPDLIACGHVLTAPPALLARRVLGISYAVFCLKKKTRACGAHAKEGAGLQRTQDLHLDVRLPLTDLRRQARTAVGQL